MKNIFILIFFISTCPVFSQPILNEICSPDDPVIIDINPITTVIHETRTDQPFLQNPPPPPPPPGDRIIFWIHGIGGGPGSWAAAADEVRDTRNVASLQPTYSEFSLDIAGGELHDNQLVPLGIPSMIFNEVDDPMDNFIIAHSQGGIVSRATDAFYIDEGYTDEERMFGGIVTFGSPHGGAQIINSIPDIEDYIASSCIVLKDGPQAEQLSSLPWFVDFILPLDEIEDVLDKLCNFLGTQVLPNFLSNLQANITNDYAVGAAALEDLNNVPSTIPRVAFHGVEDDPLVWRTLKYLQTSPNNFPAFTADSDDELVLMAEENRVAYEMKFLEYEQLFDEYESPWPGSNDPTHWEIAQIMHGYNNGWQWWINADDSYKALIGVLEFNPINTNYFCDCSYPFQDSFVDDPDDCFSFCTVIELFEYERIDHESDGIVLASSAMAYPGADVGLDNALVGSSHMQMRNDSNLKQELKELFEGDHGFYFVTN